MLNCPSSGCKALPKEFRTAAEGLFPAVQNIKQNGTWQPSQPVILAFADNLGVGNDYRKLDKDWKNTKELENYLLSFRNNLDLLIQKTWVEKADEDRKEKLLDRVPGFIDFIEKDSFSKALGEFGVILEELAWLLFGAQSHKEDFFDYVFRIDHQLGLFWWYGGQLDHFLSQKTSGEETLKAVLLLGICYLTDF